MVAARARAGPRELVLDLFDSHIQRTYNYCMNKTTTRTINISLPIKLVKEIDMAAEGEYATRSDYIRESILRKLRADQGRWEAVSDFTQIKNGGVNIDDLLDRL